MPNARHSHSGRRWSVLLLLPLLVYAAFRSAPVAASDPTLKIEAGLLEKATADGKTTFFVLLAEKADVSGAAKLTPRARRTAFVHERLKAVAERSQAGLRRLLDSRSADYRPFWILNAIRVTGGAALLRELAARPEVETVFAERTFEIPEPRPAAAEATVNGVEWGVDNVRAPQVWSAYGARGEGIVVAGIDTGAHYDHPAIVRQYRGNLGGGRFDHNYNWYDPSGGCTDTPCDVHSHGTHITGTMVGDDGGANKIGVAPGAQWIACAGCATCTLTDLVACGQWVVAPTDLNGRNPRPDLAPHVVNNSWGGGSGDYYQTVVDNWVAAGIFPAFANGNGGPHCSTSSMPGNLRNSYAMGAYDINNEIAPFSSRGSYRGEIKPNISAPGVSVRSSILPSLGLGDYFAFSGTSMATPHVAGGVALLWSAVPSLEGKIAETRALLDGTAIDMPNETCGGTDADNNTWGEGRLDVLAAAQAAAQAAPQAPATILRGTVTDQRTGAPLPGTTIRATGPSHRSAVTDASGSYRLTLPSGTYDLMASRFAYVSETRTRITLAAGGATQDFVLKPLRTFSVAGVVRDGAGQPVVGAGVIFFGSPVGRTTTDAAGAYQFASVPEGHYQLRVDPTRCLAPQTTPLVVDGKETRDFTLGPLTDSFGHICEVVPAGFIDADTVLPLTGDDAAAAVALPFPFPFYGQTYSTASVATNGFLDFLGAPPFFANRRIPDVFPPNAAIYPYWDDLVVDEQASVRTRLLGAAPNRQFVVEWRNVAFFGEPARRLRFEVVLFEDGRILTQYANLEAGEQGEGATIGIENADGTVAVLYSHDRTSLDNTFAVLYRKR